MSASTARQATPAVTRRSYVALDHFESAIFNYSYGLNEQLLREVGSLTLNPDANSGNCPKGAILHENGRKLTSGNGVPVFMVGVYDPQSGLSGFINPNSPLFGLQNTDKPIYLNDNEPLGNGVLTNGTIESTQSVTAGKFLTNPVGSTRGTALAPLTASAGTAGLEGSGYDTVVYTTQVNPSSMVFVTINNVTPRKVSVVPAVGSFTVYTDVNNDNSTFYWFVLN